MSRSTLAYLGQTQVGVDGLKIAAQHADVICAITGPPPRHGDPTLDVAAAELGIPCSVDLTTLPECDYILSVQYGRILQSRHIRQARKLAMNLHLAPLPEYRGCNQFSWAIVDGAEEFGATLHVMDEGIDSGAILAERRFPLGPNAWVYDLKRTTEKAGLLVLEESLPKILAGDVDPRPQEGPGSFHVRADIAQLKRIDLAWPEAKRLRYVRATAMPGYPGPEFYV
ncbi:MAG: formyltransferase family protein [Candidatus Nanopelagicales bacterium]